MISEIAAGLRPSGPRAARNSCLAKSYFPIEWLMVALLDLSCGAVVQAVAIRHGYEASLVWVLLSTWSVPENVGLN